MGRPRTSEGLKIQMSLKMDPELYETINDIAEAVYSDRTKILHAALKIGLEEFLVREPEIAKKLKAYRERKTASVHEIPKKKVHAR